MSSDAPLNRTDLEQARSLADGVAKPAGATPPLAYARDEAALLTEFGATGQPGAGARAYIEAVRLELYERHLAGASGTEVVREFTAAVDRLLRALYVYAEREHRRRLPRLNQRLAVVARGGYGRGELNPYSDVDLLFLHDWKPGPLVEIVAEVILHALWDAGLTVGHVVRNPRTTLRMANEDFKEKTAVLDARFMAGDEQLFSELWTAMPNEVLNRNQQQFFRAKLEESRARHARFGDSVYLLEPEIKEGEGGLRDLHTALWLAKVKYKAGGLEELVQRAVITQSEVGEVLRERDFLWRVRNALHFSSRRHNDHLTFEYQERIAPTVGFAASDPREAGAALMSAYYRNASVIHRFAEGLIARAAENVMPGGLLRRLQARRIRPGVVIQDRLLGIADRDLFRREPLNLITIFADCQAHGVELSGNAYQLVRDSLALIDDRMRHDPRTGAALMGIMAGRVRVAETLEAMHRAGVLGAVIPEFGNLYARVLHDLYHIYTVDRHSLVAVRELERLQAGEFRATAELLTEVAHELDVLPMVFLALVLHDIGKGHGHDHHERGAALAGEVCRRLGLNGEETDLVVFLVREHLAMSHVAHKGDIDDERTVADFAREVGSIERLKALYLMTFADMRAVAPGVYNNWRDMLLGDLYMRALRILEQGDREAVDPERRLRLAETAVRERLAQAGASPEAVAGFLERMPPRYLSAVAPADAALHFELMRSLGDGVVATRVRHFPEREFSEFTVVTHDRPGLFAKIAGVLAANSLNILSARITTSTDGLALDIFRISHPPGTGDMAMEEERWLRVDSTLARVLTGELDVERLVEESRQVLAGQRNFVPRVRTEITVSNSASDQYTVIDVFTQDRVGLLFTITHTLFHLGLLIHLARISTYADQALDVFYVTGREGKKLAEQAIAEVKEALFERLTAWPGMATVKEAPP